MQVAEIQLGQDRAEELLAKYEQHKEVATEDDLAIMKAYKAIAKGEVIIQAHESIRQAGYNEKGEPNLAIVRANQKVVQANVARFQNNEKSQVTFYEPDAWGRDNYRASLRRHVVENMGAWRGDIPRYSDLRAVVPSIPLDMRPKRGLHLYHILWEADWSRVPVDPMLIRKLAGDLWLVCAAWDLTDVERAVLANRMGVH